MKAIVCDGYNDFKRLKIKEIATPKIKENEILIQIKASTVSTGDSVVRKAVNPFVRIVFGLRRPRKAILGTDMAGVIKEVGKNVTKFKVGDPVVASTGIKFGGHAEYIALNQEATVVKIPSYLSFINAVSLPFGGNASLHYLRKMKNSYTAKILIYGASGAVGSSCIQLAKSTIFGFEVTAVCSQRNIDLVSALGADFVLDYTSENWEINLERYDYIFDAVGKTSKKQWKRYIKRDGKFYTISKGFVKESPDDLKLLVSLASQDVLKPVIDSIYKMNEVIEAYQLVESGKKCGNVILDFS